MLDFIEVVCALMEQTEKRSLARTLDLISHVTARICSPSLISNLRPASESWKDELKVAIRSCSSGTAVGCPIGLLLAITTTKAGTPLLYEKRFLF